FLGDGSTGGEEQELKKRGQIRKTCRDQGQRGSQSAARSWPKGKVGRSASASLGGGNTGGEDLRLKERVCFRKTRRVQGNAGDRGLHPGYCSTGGEELQLKKRGQIRKTRRGQGN
ncbi:hypothetical protein, partial [Bacillus amyloliquefaciens]|uniref:hypothetical protein n=1 Tax=Bacillus amyloliquefaciens TaxID=1390 RepID=UPI001584F245